MKLRAVTIGFALCWLATLACGDVSGSSTSVLSIQFDSLSAPSVVVGDTLRDTTGAVILPKVHAFNFKGDEILLPPVRFVSPDSGVVVDSLTGIVFADSLRSTPARIVASVGGLQAIQKIDVTLRPDSLAAVNGLDSLSYSLLDTTLNVSPMLTVKLTHGVPPNDSAVKSYIVSFAIVSQSDPQLGQIVNDAGKPAVVDTTDVNGIAGRAIRLHPLFLASATAVDTIKVDATAKYRGSQVKGSPVRLILIVKPRS
ncbi:MAG: hypothetical protein JWL97_1901 [Gemmatimonadales bacterium]|jgi:hypothetical protein|nr:hypothetical protein [Gemmatimonadales bacterium]